MSIEANFSEGEEPKEMADRLGKLLVANGGRWNLCEDGKGVERSFQFQTFKITWVSSRGYNK